MKAVDGVIAIVVVALLGVIAVLAMGGGGGPSCEERGGRRVLSHLNPVFTGKTMVMVPVYRCEGVAP